MRGVLRWAWIGAVAAVVIALDQWTKGLVEAGIPLHGSFAPFPALERYFTIVHWTNTGAAFGILRGQRYVMLVIPVIVTVAVLLYARTLPPGYWAIRTCMGLQVGGAIGNLIDRWQVGHVTDFLLFSLPIGNRVYSWPAWNVADASIVVGTILLGVLLLLDERKHAATRAAEGMKHDPSTTDAAP